MNGGIVPGKIENIRLESECLHKIEAFITNFMLETSRYKLVHFYFAKYILSLL